MPLDYGLSLASLLAIDLLLGYDTGVPSGWIATNAPMAASDPRFADEFWGHRRARGIGPSLGGLVQTLVLKRLNLIFTLLCIVAFYAVDWSLSSRPRFAFRGGD